MNYHNKTVWITGASSGIGEALACELAKQNAHLILSARNEEKLVRVSEACKKLGAKTLVLPFDLTNSVQIAQAVETVKSALGSVDVLINNGGIGQRANAIDTELEVDRAIMETDYFGHIALTKKVLPLMIANGGGQIAVMSSLAGLFGFPMRSAYCAAKHALNGFFETIRIEHNKEKVRVTIFCPGRIKTNFSLTSLDGKGDFHGKMDEGQANGLPVEKAAKQMVKALEKEKKLVVIGKLDKIMPYLKRFAPFLFYFLIYRIKPQ